MKGYITLAVIVGFLVMLMTGCSNQVKVIGDQQFAELYVKELGYQVTSRVAKPYKYVLEHHKFVGSAESTWIQQIWSVQKEDPDQYIGKEITVYGFTVKQHPLEERYDRETIVGVMMCDGKVIGGTSSPVQTEVVFFGTPYSIDGKTMEEVTGLSYQAWSEKWAKKYGS